MSNYIKMVDCSEEELMHYGVLGMKWHHHKAKGYYNKMMRYKNSAQVKGQDAVRMIGQPGENRKQTKALLKGSQKDLVKANKYLQKHNKYIDKMNAGFDENRDKVMKSKKYTNLLEGIENINSQKEWETAQYKKGDYADYHDNPKNAYEDNMKFLDKEANKLQKKADNMTNKVEKKRKKYVSFVY